MVALGGAGSTTMMYCCCEINMFNCLLVTQEAGSNDFGLILEIFWNVQKVVLSVACAKNYSV